MRATAYIRAIICVGVLATQTPGSRAVFIQAYPLGDLVGEAKSIFVLRIVEVDKPDNKLTFTKVADLKGKCPAQKVRYDLGLVRDPLVWEWAKPGQEAICFQCEDRGYLCLGNTWYYLPSADNSDIPRDLWTADGELDHTYVGPLNKLREHIAAILAGKEVVITAAARQNELDAVSHAPQPPDWLHGRKAKVWRIKASLKITDEHELFYPDSAYRVGWGVGGEEIVPSLVASLEAKSCYVRSAAVYDLGTLGPQAKGAVPALRAALTDEDAYVRVFAAEALLRIDSANDLSMPILAKALKSPDAAVRRMTAGVLADLGSQARPRASELRTTLREDSDASVRTAAAYALGQLALDAPPSEPWLPDAVMTLAKALREDRDESVRLWSAKALLKFGPQAADGKPALAAALLDKGYAIAEVAADVVARLGRDGVPLLAEALRDRRCPAHRKIVDHLADFGPRARAAVPSLLETLKEDDPALVVQAAEALYQVDRAGSTPAAVASLIGILKRKTLKGIRTEYVISALARMGREARPAAPVLCKLLSANSASVRRSAVGALGEIRPGEACCPMLLRAAQRETDAADRVAAALALWHNGDRRDAMGLFRDMLCQDWDRLWLVARLGELGPGANELLPELRRLMHRKDDPNLAMAAATAFARIATPAQSSGLVFDPRQEAILVLWDRVKDKNTQLRAISHLGDVAREGPTALRMMIRLLNDTDPDIRGDAAATLCDSRARAAAAAPGLEKMLKDSDIDNRRLAATALWQIGSPGVRSSLLLELLERHPWLLRLDSDTPHELGPEAARLVPWLRRLRRHDDRSVYQDAAALLRQTDPKAAAQAGVP